MTVAEMHIMFKLEFDKVDSLAYPNFVDAEIDLLLNIAQDLLITKRYREFEMTQKRIDDLRTIVIATPLTCTAIDATTYSATLPNDYWFALSSNSTGTGTVCGVSQTVTLKNIQTTYDRITMLLDDPFNKPDTAHALMVFKGNEVIIYTDGTVVTSINLTYLRKPLRMSLSATGVNNPVGFTNQCELADHIHREVVAESVRRSLEAVASERYQSNRQEPIE